MFNRKKIEDLEDDIYFAFRALEKIVDRLEIVEKKLRPVPPAKAPKKRGEGQSKNIVVKKDGSLAVKRKYVKSGKYAKVTTKKK